MRKVRVLYSFPQSLGVPGVAATAWNQVQGVIDEGCEVRLYATSIARPVSGAAEVHTTLTVNGRKIPQRITGQENAGRWHDRRVARAIVAGHDQIDVVHCWPRACLATAAAAHRYGIPVLREAPSAHTAEAWEQAAREQELMGLDLPRGHPFQFNQAKLDRELAEFAAVDGLLVPSDHAAATYVKRGIPESRVLRHRYGFDPARFRPAAEPRPDRPFTALFAGRGEPTKGVHYALWAWAASGLADAGGRFLIAGSMLPEYGRRLEQELAHPSVEVLPFVSDIERVMQDADVLVLPSVTEGSALVTYEAQGTGCAPLVSDASGADCRHMVEGLIHEARDVPTLTEHLRSVAGDPALLASLRAGALAHRDALTWRHAARELTELYESRASGPVAGEA